MSSGRPFFGLVVLANLACVPVRGTPAATQQPRRGDLLQQVSANMETVCAVDTVGRVLCRGGNDSGQRGDSREEPRDTLLQVPLAGRAEHVSVGEDRACAVLHDGSVACWGSNRWGTLGDGLRSHGRCPRAANLVDCSPSPVRVRGLEEAVEVAVGEYHVCARRRAGQVVCWGMNAYGQLGDGSRDSRPTPVPVLGVADAAQLAVGTGFTCALRRGGAVVCWGINSLGQLGDGTSHARCDVSRHATDSFGTVDCSTRPVSVAVSGATRIGAGSVGACAVVDDGTVRCWGRYPGDDAPDGRPVPRPVPWVQGAVDVSVGEWHACVLMAGGRLTCWGRPLVVGRASDSSASCPTSYDRCVIGDPAPAASGRIVRFSAGHAGTCAILRSGTLECW